MSKSERLARGGGVCLAVAVMFAAVSAAVGAAAPSTEARDPEILLRSRRFVPPEDRASGLRAAAGAAVSRPHVILQFRSLPDAAQWAALEAAGVRLLDYLPRNAFLASIPRGLSPEAEALRGVRWVGALGAEDRVAPELLAREPATGAESVELDVRPFEDEKVSALAERLLLEGLDVHGFDESSPSVLVRASRSDLLRIASDDAVRWVGPAPPRLVLHNDLSRADVSADIVQAPPYGLSGDGVNIGIWDGSGVKSHPDFGDRLTVVDPVDLVDPFSSKHSTHVAGTMAGDGSYSAAAGGTPFQWKGVAPGAKVFSYDFNPPTGLDSSSGHVIETRDAITRFGIEISQNSWGYMFDPDDPQQCGCSCLGSYDSLCRDYDGFARGLQGKKVAVVFSAGNERGSAGCTLAYRSMTPLATAKNVVAVGGVNSDDDSMLDYSSWGPTKDGRIKPEVVAPGCSKTPSQHVKSTSSLSVPNVYYDVLCGTSMAAPVVSGSAALLWEQYRNTYGQEPLPSTIKALLAGTAKDLDSGASFLAPGPDYASGYGRVDVQSAVDRTRGGAAVEGISINGRSHAFLVNVPPSAAGVRATLAWDDVPGAENAALELVNDLDLVAADPDGTRHFPWTLDPSNPAMPAARTAEDHVNNIEQVWVEAPYIPGIWSFKVVGRSVPKGPQSYSLVVTPDAGFKPFGIELPAEGVSFAPDSVPPAFTWSPWSLDIFKVIWSRTPNFSDPRRGSGKTWLRAASFTPTDGLWVKILQLGLTSGTIYWKVYGRDATGALTISAPQSFQLTPKTAASFTSPEDGATISKSAPPQTFTWDANANRLFKVRFSTTASFLKPRYSNGDFWLTTTSWTPSASLWNAILTLAARGDGQTVYYQIISRDRVGRVTYGQPRTFLVVP